jgi:hypothetical protein
VIYRFWPILVGAIVVIGLGIAILQGKPDPLAGYGALLAALTLSLQLQRLTGERPLLRLSATVQKVNKVADALAVRAHNDGGGSVTIQAIGFAAAKDEKSSWQFGGSPVYRERLAEILPKTLIKGGPRLEVVVLVEALVSEMLWSNGSLPHFAWVEAASGERTWTPMPPEWTTKTEAKAEQERKRRGL